MLYGDNVYFNMLTWLGDVLNALSYTNKVVPLKKKKKKKKLRCRSNMCAKINVYFIENKKINKILINNVQ
jgi:hypothetical protein